MDGIPLNKHLHLTYMYVVKSIRSLIVRHIIAMDEVYQS